MYIVAMSPAARTRLIRLLVRVAISGLFLALFALHIAGKPRLEIVDRIENYLYDVRIRMTMPGTVDERIVIIDIDEASQAELGQWPWPRNTLATLVDRLFDDYGIQVLGLDALFAEAEETSAERVVNELSASAIAGSCFDSPLIDADGVFRRAPLVQRFRGDLYPSLALAVARIALQGALLQSHPPSFPLIDRV